MQILEREDVHAPGVRDLHPRGAEGAELHAFRIPAAIDGPSETMTIRLADCEGQRNRANMLLSKMYEWRGYGARHAVPTDPNCVTFTATAEATTIGTLTLTVDSPSGLAVDKTFKDAVEPFRQAPGAKLCELTRFAFDSSSPARPRLGALFHIIFIYGSMHYNCTDLLIEVNPRHRKFYEAMLGFKSVGEPRANAAVGAPSQLMWLNVGEIRRYIDRQEKSRNDGRSLYPHFFSASEERGIYGRLLALRKDTDTLQDNAPVTGTDPSLALKRMFGALLQRHSGKLRNTILRSRMAYRLSPRRAS